MDCNIMLANSFIKGIFNKGKEVVQVFSRSQLLKEYQFISDNFQMELSMEKENSLMMMELDIKANGKMEKNMDLAN